jgi:DNA-binding GntR family transcriptional regulator
MMNSLKVVMRCSAFEVRLQLWLTRGYVDLLTVQEAHWKIIDALEIGDGSLAGELLHKHIYNLPGNEPASSPKIGTAKPKK